MNQLVNKLSQGPQRVILARTRTVNELLAAIQNRFVLLTFVDTEGGTELGVPLDAEETRIDRADFTAAEGTVHLAGRVIIDFAAVTVHAEIELPALTGLGTLHLTQ